ncbi:MAG TPA: GNAT family N-acetyltransferase [Actinomycetota bacterium]
MVNEIKTERLWLRQLPVEEARALLNGTAQPELPWMAGYPIEGSMIAAEAYVRAIDGGQQVGPYGLYQIVVTEEGLVVGDIGFHGPPDPVRSVTIGYGLAAPARGHGYVTEALRALIAWAMAQPEVRRVEGDAVHANLASQRVMERAGMRYVGSDVQLRYYRYP